MPVTFGSAVFPVVRRFIGLAKETSPGTVVAPTYTFPMTAFKPVDKITYLEDAAWRNAMAGLYNIIPGVRIADLSMGGPFFADGIGYVLLNTLGDYWQSAPPGATPGTTTTTTALYTPPAATLAVTSGTNLPANAIFGVGTPGSTNFEVRQVTAGGGTTTITMNAPMYQSHASASVVTPYTAVTNYSHNFSLLNSGVGAGGYNNAQPVTQTWTDYTGVTASVGARNYAFTCLSDLTLTGVSTALVEWDCKAVAVASAIAGATPTTTLSTVAPQPSWNSTVTLAAGQVFNNAEWKLTLTRKLEPKFTNSAQRDPFSIPRGELTGAFSLNFDPALDESEWLYYINNTQPALVVTAQNGLSGASAAQITMTSQLAAFTTGEIVDNRVVFGYDTTQKLVANTTNVGPSGGFSPILVNLQNNVISY